MLGLTATSAGAITSVRSRADELGIDYAHFSVGRVKDEALVRAAVRSSATWEDAAASLGLQSLSGIALLKGHALRWGIPCRHLDPPALEPPVSNHGPDLGRLDRAGTFIAAAWFSLCGYGVSWPLEPGRYDLAVEADGRFRRVQVKTTRSRTPGGGWKVYLSTTGRERRTYSPDEIDEFFIVEGDLNYYAIPISAVGGLQAIHLDGYQEYRLPNII